MLYVTQFAGSYILMLLVMTYNVWILVVTVLGLGVGYFLCGWGSLRPEKDNCACRLVPYYRHHFKTPDTAAFKEVPRELLPLKPGCALEGQCSSCNTGNEIRETDILWNLYMNSPLFIEIHNCLKMFYIYLSIYMINLYIYWWPQPPLECMLASILVLVKCMTVRFPP